MKIGLSCTNKQEEICLGAYSYEKGVRKKKQPKVSDTPTIPYMLNLLATSAMMFNNKARYFVIDL